MKPLSAYTEPFTELFTELLGELLEEFFRELLTTWFTRILAGGRVRAVACPYSQQ
jgi:hypothetical protein